MNNKSKHIYARQRALNSPILLECLLFVLFLILSSCDPAVTIEYKIENHTAKPLIVKSQFMFSSTNDTSYRIISISSNSNKVINAEIHLGTIDIINARRDSMTFSKLVIEQDGKISNYNIKDKKQWILIKGNDRKNTYLLVVDSNFFKH